MTKPTERQQAIYDLRESGATFTAIAKVYGVTPGRVRQIYEVAKRKIAAAKRHEAFMAEWHGERKSPRCLGTEGYS